MSRSAATTEPLGASNEETMATNPSAAEIMAVGPTVQMQERLRALLERSHAGALTPSEEQALDEYERIEHLMILIKTGSLPYLRRAA